MNEYKVFYAAGKKDDSIMIEAKDETEARQKGKAKLITMFGPPVDIRFVNFERVISDT